MSVSTQTPILNRLSRLLALGLFVVFFLLCLGISTQPAIFGHYSVLAYAHLIVVFLMLQFSRAGLPLWLLFILGLMIDSTYMQLLGSSSVLLMILHAIIQPVRQSMVRYSVLVNVSLFGVFLVLYVGIQLWLQTVWLGLFVDLEQLSIEYSISLVVLLCVVGLLKKWAPTDKHYW